MQKIIEILTKYRLKFELASLVMSLLGFSLLATVIFRQHQMIVSLDTPVIITQKTECPVVECETQVSSGNFVTVDIGGAVNVPGVYSLPAGSLLTDLVQKAGGLRPDHIDPYFLQKRLNLAQSLNNNQKYYIPYKGEAWQAEAAIANDDSVQKTTDGSALLISVNNATLKQLTSLSGIGEVRAQAIIDHRPYGALSDLVTSGALTESLFAKIEGLVTL
ncbi:helix-hairpin-helix domain-containing protein [bacterium]|nr:helix-hairpin-helix domain-containing protein [bacterium]